MNRNILLYILVILSISLKAQTSDSQSIKISDDIYITKISENAYIHISISDIDTFKNVHSNGLILVDQGKCFLFDTPMNSQQTEKLVKWIEDSLKSTVKVLIPNHYHRDCIGGLDYLHHKKVKSYSNQITAKLAAENKLPLPQHTFKDSLSLKLNKKNIYCYYLGAAHSKDNIVVWIPSEKILFGGCMIKDLTSNTLGNTAEADIKEWPKTIDKIINKFPDAQIIIPGHGLAGSTELLYHTKNLLKSNQ